MTDMQDSSEIGSRIKSAAHRSYDRYLFSMCGLAGLLYGIDMGLIAAALPYIKETCSFSPAQLSSIVAAVLLGGIPGKALSAFVAERWGRLAAFRLTGVVFALAVPVICFSNGVFAVMFAGRLMQGVGCALVGISGPLYLAECVDAKDRGKGTGMIQLVLTVGLVAAALVGLVVTKMTGSASSPDATLAAKTAAWQAIFWVSLVPTYENRVKVATLIREFAPDFVITHRTCDYHVDHRTTGTLVMDAGYLLGVPHWIPEVPAQRLRPVFLYMTDQFSNPREIRPDIMIDATPYLDKWCDGLDAQVSQVYDWLAYDKGVEGDVKALGDRSDLAKRNAYLRKYWSWRRRYDAERFADAWRERYPDRPVPTDIETFEVSEYGRAPTEEDLNLLLG